VRIPAEKKQIQRKIQKPVAENRFELRTFDDHNSRYSTRINRPKSPLADSTMIDFTFRLLDIASP